MSSTCKIIVYHYVRPIKESRYTEIKGLEVADFIRQIKYFKANFNFITVEQFLDHIYNKGTIPNNSILLTFDDGFKDHYLHVFPVIRKLGIQGLFFLPAQAIEENKILDVHKIQFVLATCKNKHDIINKIRDLIEQYKEEYKLDSFESYFSKFVTYDRFDTKEISFIKRMLQKNLPRKLRNKLTDELFNKYVTKDQELFSNNLYISFDEICEMSRAGMYFGSHGYSHEWLSSLSSDELEIELEKSLNFYYKINQKNDDLIMCYPYGDYNNLVIQKLKTRGFKAGFTTEVGDAELTQENVFTLKRYDTNDFPK